jgi:phytoene dehydrogenase-like protein
MYDLIVIGEDISSHVAAAVASHCGLNTALVAESGIGGKCLIGDFAFNIDPTPLTGFSVNQACFSLFAGLDIPPAEQEIIQLNPAYQIILPEHRIDFFSDKESLVKEIVREFPELAVEINSFYDAVVKNLDIFGKWLHDHPLIQPRSIKDYYNYLKLMPYLIKYKFDIIKLKRIISRNTSFKKVMEAQQALLSFTTNNQDSIASHFQYSAPLRGIYCFLQGKQVFFDSLIKKMESTNGLLLNNCEVLSIKKGGLVEVDVIDKHGIISKISAKSLIVSTKWKGMHLLLEGKKKINMNDWVRPIKVSHYPFTIHLGIRQKCIPEKMARHVAVISDVNKDIYDNNLIILELYMPQGEKTVSLAKNSLTATVFLSNDRVIWSDENLAANAQSIIGRLEYFLPFLKDNIEIFDIEKSIDISKKQRDIINPKYQLRNSFISCFAAKNNKTRFGNVYLTGASLLTDAGFEGEIISGINAVARIAGKRK